MPDRVNESRIVTAALTRLRDAADLVDAGWRPGRWRVVDGDGGERDIETFDDLDLHSGERRTIRTNLNFPTSLYGVELTDDVLEMTVSGIYPIEVTVDGTVFVAEGVPPVATGPALVDVIKGIRPGAVSELEATLTPAPGQGGTWGAWLSFVFTTPRLRAKFDELDLAWAQLSLAHELAVTPTERAVVVAAAGLVPADLTGTDSMSAALAEMAAVLTPATSWAAAPDVHVIGHSHIDLAWLWTWDDTREVIKRDLRSVLAIMRDYPEATFTHSQPAGYEVIRRDEPDLFTEIVAHIEAGRWEAATAQWVEGDTNLASGEAMASQLLEGAAFSREHLGVEPKVFMAPDTFGHSENLPQLVTDAGATIYYHTRCNPGAAHGRQWPAYWWEGQDGTRIFACSTASYNGAVTAGAIARASVDAWQAGLPAGLLLVGVGDHGGGPTRRGYDTLRRVGTAALLPRAQCSTLSSYAERVQASGAELPVHRGESPTIFEGCYTTHVDAKQANRDGENRLVTAEALAALAGLPNDLQLSEAWRAVCFHQFHDIIDGSAIPEAYAKTRADHERVIQVTDRVTDTALRVLTFDCPSGTVAVTNPHGHECTDVVTVRTINELPRVPVLVDELGARTPGQVSEEGLVFVARVPAFGTARYQIEPEPSMPSSREIWVAGEGGTADDPRYFRVATPHFRVAIRRDCGVITSFVDQRTGQELVAFGMQRMTDYGDTARPDLGLNVFQVVDERPHFMSSWQYQEVGAEYSLLDGAATEIVEEGPVRIVVRVTHQSLRRSPEGLTGPAGFNSRLVEDIIFYRDLPRVDFVARVDWREPAGVAHGVPNLKVAFTPDLDASEAWFETPYGAVQRRANGQQVPALRWVDVGGPAYGVAIINDSTYGHDVLGSRIRLNLVRTAYVPDRRSDHGIFTFRFSMLPHIGDWRDASVPHVAAAFNQPLIARYIGEAERSKRGGLPRWRPEIGVAGGLVTTALRAARDGSGSVIRLAEVSGRRSGVTVRGLPAEAPVWESGVTEQRRRVTGRGPTLSLQLRPWEVRTLIVETD